MESPAGREECDMFFDTMIKAGKSQLCMNLERKLTSLLAGQSYMSLAHLQSIPGISVAGTTGRTVEGSCMTERCNFRFSALCAQNYSFSWYALSRRRIEA